MTDEDDETEKIYKFGELSPEAQEHAIEQYRENNDWDDYDTKELTERFEERLEELGLPHDKVHWSLGHVQGDGVSFQGKIDIKEYLKKNKLLRDYASLFAPAFEEEAGGRLVGPKQRGQAEGVASSIEHLGFMTNVRQGKDCFYIDVFENGDDKMDRVATFCVSVKHGRQINVSVESETESGSGAWLLKRAGEQFTNIEKRSNYDIPIDMLSFTIDSSNRYYSMSVEYDFGVPEDWLSPEQKRDFETLYEHIKNHVREVASDLAHMGYDEIEYRSSDETITENIEANEYDFDEEGNMVR